MTDEQPTADTSDPTNPKDASSADTASKDAEVSEKVEPFAGDDDILAGHLHQQ